ncbi:Sortase family protein [Klenkia soli]|uniref:Sortase family protein n=1 Tax=Klenkia soli TaxID=1052260 RepID=A0A1H0PY71_9ACTN|nr:class F sortase [Klenkia soli]SDP10072.1 Sortase family protein [Klenkia soli]
MRHRAPESDLPEQLLGEVDAVRILGAYPPPVMCPVLPRSVPAVHVTRYDRRRSRRTTTRAWTTVSASLATAGVAVLLLAPTSSSAPVRQEVAAATAPTGQVDVVPSAAPAVTAAVTAAAPAVPAPPVLAASAPVAMRIPVLRADADVVELGLRRDGSMETPNGAEPVGWYTGSPTPGALGPAVLAGHVDWDGEPGTFVGLRELLPGDEVEVLRADGTTAVFTVDRVEEHAKDAFPTDEVYGDTPTAQLRLITCGGSFDEDTGDYRDNVVVFASLAGAR